MANDPKLLQAMDDLLVVYDFLLRGERAEGDAARLQSALAPAVRGMTQTERDRLFEDFHDRARDDGWDDDGIDEFLEWLAEELGLEQDLEPY